MERVLLAYAIASGQRLEIHGLKLGQSRPLATRARDLCHAAPRAGCLEALQSKKLLDADVLGEFEQGIEMLVLAQRLAIDFNFER